MATPLALLIGPLAGVLLSLGVLPPLPGSTGPTPASTLPRLVTEGKAPAAALLSTGPYADHFVRTGPGIRRSDHFRAGSITKTFIATVVLQLVAEHRIALSAPVRLPGLLDADGDVTVRALLNHTSGLPDFTTTTHGTRPLAPAEAIRTALALPRLPAGQYAYSNTNYVALGLLIEQTTGRPYDVEATARVIDPLRLTGTSFPGARTTLPLPHGRAYSPDGRDVTALDPRVAGASGELVSTLDDLNRFYAALLSGDLLPERELSAMLDARATDGAYGMALHPVRLACGRTVWGHNGRIAGSYVRTAATRDGRHTLTFRINTDELAEPSLERELLDSEFCP